MAVHSGSESRTMIYVFRPWQSRLLALLIAGVTFGLVRIDAPRVGRMQKMRLHRRWWLALEARYHGRRDGRIGIPRPDEVGPPPEIWNLKQQGDATVRDLSGCWSATDARLSGEHEAMRCGIETIDGEIGALEREVVLASVRRERRRETLEQMKREDEKRRAEDRW